MNQSLMTEFKEDLKDFREMTEKFYAKKVSVKDYKGFSGGFGSYAQRGAEASMLRLRMPGGVMTKENWPLWHRVLRNMRLNGFI